MLEGTPNPSRYLKTNITVFRYDDTLPTMGWMHDVIYDKKSEDYIIVDFPDSGQEFEMSMRPSVGLAKIGIGEQTYTVRIFEFEE